MTSAPAADASSAAHAPAAPNPIMTTSASRSHACGTGCLRTPVAARFVASEQTVTCSTTSTCTSPRDVACLASCRSGRDQDGFPVRRLTAACPAGRDLGERHDLAVGVEPAGCGVREYLGQRVHLLLRRKRIVGVAENLAHAAAQRWR